MSWYRTYRPTTLAGLHLVDVRASLLRLLETNQFPHALLFAGPKGTGKTSAARIISAILNDPQNGDAVESLFFQPQTGKKVKLQEPNLAAEIVQRIQRGSSYAVQELDAASNRGIDDIRALKERVYLPPQEGKVSVYILDEVHMLTTEAFNALLKLLEEPPAHVVFILATTELHKLPETVVSRTTVIRFHTASAAELTAALTHILDAEKIRYELPAIEQLAQLAEGSFRDAVKLLEQVAAGQPELTLAAVTEIFHLSEAGQFLALVTAISQKDAPAVVTFFAQLRQQQVNESFFYRRWLQFLHHQLLQAVTSAGSVQALVPEKISHYLLSQFHHLPADSAATIPFLTLELKSLEIVFKAKERDAAGSSGSNGGSGNKSVPKLAPKPVSVQQAEPLQATNPVDEIANVVPIAIVDYEETLEVIPEIQALENSDSPEQNTKPAILLIEQWAQFLAALRGSNLTLEALLRSATPRLGADGKAQIEVYYQFHREQLQQPKFLHIIQQCVFDLLGGYVQFEFVLAKKAEVGAASSTVTAQVNPDDPLVQLAKDMLV